MAEKQGITWGGAIKGVAKVTGVLVVSVGIAMASAYGIQGIATYFEAADASMLGRAGGAGAAVAAGITDVTNGIVDFVGDTFRSVGEFFGFNDATLSGENKTPNLSDNFVKPEPDVIAEMQAEADGKPFVPADVLSTEFGEKIDKLADAFVTDPDGEALSMIASMGSEVDKAIQAYEAAGLAAPPHLYDMQDAINELGGLVDGVKNATTGTQLTAAFDALNEKLYDIDAHRHAFEGANDLIKQELVGKTADSDAAKALNDVIKANNVFLGGDSYNTVIDQASDLRDSIASELKIADPSMELKNVPEKWMAAGAAVLGAKAIHRMGENKGQREAIGAFTQAELDRRGAAARFAGMQNQLG